MLIDNRDPSSPVPSPAPSGLPSNNNASATQSYTNANNHTTISRSASTSTGFHVETYQTFDWDLYLRETNSTAAPLEYFKQVNYNTLYYTLYILIKY